MTVESFPFGISAENYSAEIVRRAIEVVLARNSSGAIGTVAGGVAGATDFLLTAPGSGLSVNVAAGECVVPGSAAFASTPSGYYLRNTATLNLPISTANPSNPRVDLVCGTINDATYHGATNNGVLQVVTGTPSSGANLTNLTGAAALPDASLLLGYVLVPAAATNIVSGDLGQAQVRLAPGVALTFAAGTIGTNVNIGINTPTKVFDTATLAIGVWKVTMNAVGECAGTGTVEVTAAVDSATATLTGITSSGGYTGSGAAGIPMSVTFFANVTAAGTLKLTAEGSNGSANLILATTATNGFAACTGYTAEKIG